MPKIIQEPSSHLTIIKAKPADRWFARLEAGVMDFRYSSSDLGLSNQVTRKIPSFAFLKWLTLIVLVAFGSPASADFASGNAAYMSGDYQKAYKLWLPGAEDGDPDSQFRIGSLFFSGYGVPENKYEAIKWYRLAADQGHVFGQVLLGLMYETGAGVAVDKAEAVKLYKLAAKQGFPKAQVLLGDLYFEQGRYTDAEPLYNQALVIQEKELGPDHLDVAKSLKSLAQLFRYQSRYADAEPLLKRALNIREKALGTEHPDVATILEGLALIYSGQSRYADAEPLLKRALDINKKALGADHSKFASVLNSLALLYQKQGHYADAESFYKRSLDISEKALGPNHSDVASVLNNLASIYQDLGRYADAEPLHKQALSIREKTLGKDHPDVAVSLGNMALLYHELGRYIEAEQLLKRSLSIYATTLGKDHLFFAASLGNLAQLYTAQSRYGDADTLYKQALSIREKALGLDHPDVAKSLSNLATLYKNQGRYADAEPLLKRALVIQEKALGPDHSHVGTVLNNLAALHGVQKRFADAELLYNRSLVIKEKALGPDHPEIASSLNNLAVQLDYQGRYADAELLYKRALGIEEKTFGPDHPQVAGTLHNLAVLYKNQGYYADAYSLFKRSLLIKEKELRPDHPEVVKTLYNLASLYHDLEKNEESLGHIRRAVALTRARAQNSNGLGMGPSSEKELHAAKFAFHVRVALGMQDPSNRDALISEAFESSQLAVTSQAGTALKNMANRFAAKDDEIAVLVRQRQDAAEQWQRLDQALVESFSQAPKDQDKVAKAILAKSIEENKDLLKKLDSKLETAFPKFAEFSSNKPTALADVQVLLGPDEALFTFISSGEGTYAFLVRKNEVQAYEVDLSEEQLVDIVTALRDDIDLSSLKNITDLPKFDLDLAYELHDKLLGPAEAMLEGVEHLLVVPAGAMESLPFNVLVTEPPAAKGSDFGRYQSTAWLPKRFSITRLPSVSSLRALRMFATNNRATDPFKGFGDPVLNGQPGAVRGLKLVDIYQGAQADTDKVRELPELPRTSDELRLIAKYLNSSEADLYLRERASETELKSADLSNSRVIGFATHGLVGGELSGMAEPALVLTPPANRSDLDDGLLTASEVAELNLNADIVLLSACNTASGETLGAEGLSGLARAFIYAGARSLLVSHWSVESGAAAELTTGLFEALEANPEMGRAEALKNSMMSLASDDENPHYSHPAFWAPFSLIGEGAVLK